MSRSLSSSRKNVSIRQRVFGTREHEHEHERPVFICLTRVGHGEKAPGAGVDHGDDAGNKDARGQISAKQEADDDRQTNLVFGMACCVVSQTAGRKCERIILRGASAGYQGRKKRVWKMSKATTTTVGIGETLAHDTFTRPARTTKVDGLYDGRQHDPTHLISSHLSFATTNGRLTRATRGEICGKSSSAAILFSSLLDPVPRGANTGYASSAHTTRHAFSPGFPRGGR